MCIAILNSSGTLDWQIFQNSWANNPDGAGIAYVEKKEVKIVKEMKSVKELYGRYVAIRKRNNLPMIIHFRIATSGMVDKPNCHPFEVKPGLAMAHNGIIENVKPSATTSDTRIFIKEVLKKLPEGFLGNDGIQRLISGFVERSKLIFLDWRGMFTIINESLGHWDEDEINWYSNRSYLEEYTYGLSGYQFSGFAAARNFNCGDFDECDACGNSFPQHYIEYDPYLNTSLCKDCMEWFYEGVRTQSEKY